MIYFKRYQNQESPEIKIWAAKIGPDFIHWRELADEMRIISPDTELFYNITNDRYYTRLWETEMLIGPRLTTGYLMAFNRSWGITTQAGLQMAWKEISDNE